MSNKVCIRKLIVFFWGFTDKLILNWADKLTLIFQFLVNLSFSNQFIKNVSKMKTYTMKYNIYMRFYLILKIKASDWDE